MNYTYTGTVVHIGDIQEFGINGFYKRDLVLSNPDDRNPQKVPFEFAKSAADKITELGLEVGDVAKVTFDLRGREHNGRYFGSMSAWKVEAVGTTKQKSAPTEPNPVDEDVAMDDESEDVPF